MTLIFHLRLLLKEQWAKLNTYLQDGNHCKIHMCLFLGYAYYWGALIYGCIQYIPEMEDNFRTEWCYAFLTSVTACSFARQKQGTYSDLLVFKAHQAECGELHALADQSQERLLELQKQHLAKTDEITRTLTEKHRLEVRYAYCRVPNEKKTKIMEFQNIYMEKSWKKNLALRAFHPILKLAIVVACRSWKNHAKVMEKSWNLIQGKLWEPCLLESNTFKFNSECDALPCAVWTWDFSRIPLKTAVITPRKFILLPYALLCLLYTVLYVSDLKDANCHQRHDLVWF